MNRMFLYFVCVLGLQSWAQHPFYLQILDDGRLAMANEAWVQAEKDLEIAAFGFLDKEELLAESYIRLTLIHRQLANAGLEKEYLRDANRVLVKLPGKPPGLETPFWESFQVLSGRKPAPRPPIPADEAALLRYVEDYPGVSEAWLALLEMQMRTARKPKVRQSFAKAQALLPENPDILARALFFSVMQDDERNAESIATKLLILRPDSSLANEYMGGLAVKRKDWGGAQSYFGLMQSAQLPKTAEYQTQLAKESSKDKVADPGEPQHGEEDVKDDGTTEIAEVDKGLDASTATEVLESPTQKLSVQSEPEKQSDPIPTPQAEPPPLTMAQKIANLEQQSRQNPADGNIKFDLIDAYLDQGSMRKAKKGLARLAKTRKDEPRYAEVYAHYQFARGNFKANIDNLSGYPNPQGAIAYYLGMSYYRLGQRDQANQILGGLDRTRFAIPTDITSKPDMSSIQPPSVGAPEIKVPTTFSQEEALDWLGAQAGQGNWSGISESIGTMIARYPTDQGIRFYQGRLLLSNNAYQDAMSIFIELVSEGYAENEIYYYAGLSALKRGNPSVAQYLFEKAQANNTSFKAEIESLLNDPSLKN